MQAKSNITPIKTGNNGNLDDRRRLGLRFSESNVHHVLDFYPDLACLCQDGKILWMNDVGEKMLKLTGSNAASDEYFAKFLVAEFADLSENFIDLILEETDPFPARLNAADGSVISVNVTAQWARELGNGTVVLTAQNITQRIRLLEDIKNSEARFRNLVDNALDLVCSCENGEITFINKTGLELLSAENWTEVIGKKLPEIFHEDYKQIFGEALGELSAEESLFPAKLAKLNGEAIDVHVMVTRSMGLDAESYMIEVRDISEHRRAVMTLHQTNQELEQRVENRTRELSEEVVRRRDAEDTLRHMATHDSLTGLPNRVRLIEELSVEKDRAMKAETSFAVMFIDLDGFKAVNDGLGHEAGDKLLCQVSERLVSSIRKNDLAARIGGDEFVVALLDLGDRVIIEKLARKILDALGATFDLGRGDEANIGGSIGIAVYPDDGETTEALLKNADSAMYDVKAAGKNNIAFISG
ncbi:MAG: GGDEF domain-containing protein [Rhodospirillaceae bacterium]|nr:GGDEF domain-containing protein [Rhodospirillaceae bacterium]MBT4589888.1 GGDEF domain-containing protein [Rhodospirillaceae bacterium]MBT4940137.1 GGDEF domain-containing protein [Rhodospirillaceae bacterium]MBT5941671.1 GGDEF domain-containing protein [Rhodospirillaceae bacterium]MBT7267371.1 GGDEF domain-containing protein [Rhodospirillaceae bacterium]